jgi:excisionase family DNA binding protein
MTENYLTRIEAASILNVTPHTVDRWAKAGHLTVYRIPPVNRGVRFKREDVEALLIPRKGEKK